ncbi:MAG: helix-turn-helix domain-containing protein [Sphingomonadales bacterium]|nr:helix-turn-helix domain-containing protein [Sphingomonadales bacterium]
MAEHFAARLREERERLGLSQKALGELGGVSKNTQLAYENGGSSIPLDYLDRLSKHGLDLDYVATGERASTLPGGLVLERHLPFRHASPNVSDDSLAIPMLELGYGMGGAFLDGIDPGEVMRHFPRDFIRMLTSAPANQLCWSHGIGDSMEPTISDRDVILIDLSRDAIRMNDQIWVLAVSGIGMVKRVRIKPGGDVVLKSDNEHVADYPVGQDELTIIGRVIAVVRRL